MTATTTRMSYTKTSTFEQCPKRFWYRYVSDVKPDPNTDKTAADIGTLVHEVFEKFYQLPSKERNRYALKDLTAQCWDANNDFKHRPDATRLKWRVWELANNIWRIENPEQVDVVDVEQEITRTVSGVDIKIVVDRVENVDDPVMVDYKTGKPYRTHHKQLDLYSAVYNDFSGVETETKVVYLKTGTVDRRRSSGAAQTEAVEWVLEAYETIIGLDVEDQSVWPAIKNGLCGWCDFKYVCPLWGVNREPVGGVKRVEFKNDRVKELIKETKHNLKNR